MALPTHRKAPYYEDIESWLAENNSTIIEELIRKVSKVKVDAVVDCESFCRRLTGAWGSILRSGLRRKELRLVLVAGVLHQQNNGTYVFRQNFRLVAKRFTISHVFNVNLAINPDGVEYIPFEITR